MKFTVYLVMSNTDLTEGRGGEYVSAVCLNETTAQHIGAGKYIQGSDCPIFKVEMPTISGEPYLPFKYVPITLPTSEDLAEEERLFKLRVRHNIREITLAKVKALGITEEELNIIMDVD